MNEDAARRDDLALYLGRNRARLLALYDARPAPFCWPGLLLPQAWFLYRKMYVWAALACAGPVALSLIPGADVLDWGVSILGALGLKLYFRQAERTCARIRAEARDGDEARALIARAGGVSYFGAGVGIVFSFAVFVLVLKGGPATVLRLK